MTCKVRLTSTLKLRTANADWNLRSAGATGPIKGSIAFTDLGWRLRGVPQAFVVIDGKLSDSADIFDAILSRKKIGIGLYDGTILPIDLLGLVPKPFIACVEYSLGVWSNLH
jgi:hypothetical protein